MKREIKSRKRHQFLDAFILADASLTSSYAANASDGKYICTAKKDGVTAGLYYIKLNDVPARAPVVVAIPLHATAKLFAKILSYSAGEIQIQVYADDGTATASTQLHVIVVNSDLANELGG